MGQSEQKIVQYLNEAHATEMSLVRVLQSQIAMTPRGSYRTALEEHLRETQTHADRVKGRLVELGEGANALEIVGGAAQNVAQSLVGQALALAKTPLDVVRGSSGEEKVLKNAKDAAATEALEIATYASLERFARSVGDKRTAELAASIREDEEQMLERVLKEIPKLTEAVVRADVEGDGPYDIETTAAGQTARAAGRTAKRTAKKAAGKTRRTASKATTEAKREARQARKVPGVQQAEGEVKGAVASESDLPIANYDSLNADEIVGKLNDLSQIDLAKVDAYERKNENRTTVLGKIDTLRGDEPWPGYDEQTVSDIQAALDDLDENRLKEVRAYERAHKDRAGVLKATERELSNA